MFCYLFMHLFRFFFFKKRTQSGSYPSLSNPKIKRNGKILERKKVGKGTKCKIRKTKTLQGFQSNLKSPQIQEKKFTKFKIWSNLNSLTVRD